jgi:hypothetical protein
MNEIKVYHSIWKSAITIVVDLLLMALGVSGVLSGTTPILAGCLAAFFCFGAVMAAWPLVKERITKEPYLTITDDCVKVSGRKGQEFRFADVESFVLKRFLFDGIIEVNYRNERTTPGAIMVSDVAIKLKDLHAILNERLEAHK